MDIEKALEASNPLGRVQVLILIATSLGYIETGFIALSSVFLAEVPDHHCAVSPSHTLNETVPIDEHGVYLRCEEYVNSSVSNETQSCSNGWEYDTEVYGESITSEWDLVCNNDYLPELSQSILLAGFGVGSIMAGPAADRFGRKPTAVVAVVIINILGIAISYSPNYAVFVSLRFTFGFIYKAVSIPITTMMYECLLPKHRSTVGNIPPFTGTLGLMLMAVLAALVKDWFYFNIVLMSPMFLLVLFVWFIPESVRWQISQGKIEKAEKTIQRMAKLNKAKDFPPLVFTAAEEMKSTGDAEKSVLKQTETNVKKKGGVMMLFKPPTVIVTFIMGWFMFTFTIVYFGFALTTGSLAGDPYLNFFLSCLVEVPARIIPLFIVRRTGSLRPLLATFFISGITMVAIIIVESTDGGPEWLLTTLSLLGKFFITFAFAPISLLITELFPTTVRNSGTGVAQLIGNIGSLLSPLLLYMDKFVANLSLIFMTVAAFVSAVLCLCLPETLNTTQPETPADLKVLFDTKRIFSFGKSSHKDSISSKDGKVGVVGDTEVEGDKEIGIINEGFEPDTQNTTQSETPADVQIISETKEQFHNDSMSLEDGKVLSDGDTTVAERDKEDGMINEGASREDSMSLEHKKSLSDDDTTVGGDKGTPNEGSSYGNSTGTKDKGTMTDDSYFTHVMSSEEEKVGLEDDRRAEGDEEITALNKELPENDSVSVKEDKVSFEDDQTAEGHKEKEIIHEIPNDHASISVEDTKVGSKDNKEDEEDNEKEMMDDGSSQNDSMSWKEGDVGLEDESTAKRKKEMATLNEGISQSDSMSLESEDVGLEIDPTAKRDEENGTVNEDSSHNLLVSSEDEMFGSEDDPKFEK